MKLNRFCALLLCTATLLSGCGTASNSSLGSDVSAQSESDASQPLSELDRLALQARAWEEAGSYDDEEAYRNALMRTAALVQKEGRGAYLCDDPQELGEAKLEALTDAAMRCNYAYSMYMDGEDPFSPENLPSTIAMLILYTPGALESTWGDDPTLPQGWYRHVKLGELQPYLDGAVAPAGQAFRAYQGDLSAWNWYPAEEGYIYVNVSGLTSTLPSGEPQFTSVESLGGDRYLVVCEMLPIGASFKHQLAFVVEDTALAGETPHVTVLDCVSAAHRESYTLDWNELEALRTTYRVFSEDGQEALDVLERLEALSPIPFHTDLAGQMSPALEQALEDAKLVHEMLTTRTFEKYVIALSVSPTMYRWEYSQENEWIPAEPGRGTYGDAWNKIPAPELEEAFRMRFGMDLTANNRAWLKDSDFVPTDDYTEAPTASFDGEFYNVYLRGVGGPIPFPYETTLIYNYDGTYTALFTMDTTEYFPDSTSTYDTLTLRLRNVGTEEDPFFQLPGHELPA